MPSRDTCSTSMASRRTSAASPSFSRSALPRSVMASTRIDAPPVHPAEDLIAAIRLDAQLAGQRARLLVREIAQVLLAVHRTTASYLVVTRLLDDGQATRRDRDGADRWNRPCWTASFVPRDTVTDAEQRREEVGAHLRRGMTKLPEAHAAVGRGGAASRWSPYDMVWVAYSLAAATFHTQPLTRGCPCRLPLVGGAARPPNGGQPHARPASGRAGARHAAAAPIRLQRRRHLHRTRPRWCRCRSRR